MLVPFENMPDNARVWVYQSSKKLSAAEIEFLQKSLNEQVGIWAAHGAPLTGSYKIDKNRFVIIAVDEKINSVSGCSIDASTGWLKSLGSELGINFFDRSLAYLNNDEVCIAALPMIKTLVNEGSITENTVVFNNLVNTISDLKQNWQVEASKSWTKRYFINQPV